MTEQAIATMMLRLWLPFALLGMIPPALISSFTLASVGRYASKLSASFPEPKKHIGSNITFWSEAWKSRREAFLTIVQVATGVEVLTGNPLASCGVENEQVLRLESPDDKAGLALYDVTIGNPPQNVVAIKRVISKDQAGFQPGLVLKDYPNARAVVDRIRRGPYPIELKFYNLDSSNGELGEALTAQGAPVLSQQQAAESNQEQKRTPQETPSGNIADSNNRNYVKRVIKEPPSCRIKSRRDDVLEIIYEAHIGTMDGIMYDSSATRGTGRPYQMVLGSGDMIPGLDQGLYDMCPGEVRHIEMPPLLAYGAKGNKIFRIPPNARLVWEVELVSVNSMRQDQQDESSDY